MCAKKIEKKNKNTENVEDDNKTGEEETFLAEVINVYNVVGSGGSVKHCKVEIKKTKRMLIRSIYGPVRVGDLLQLRDCVRESRKLR
ncbi:rps28e [Ecytonucleospora hepatopenaei]|uniref:Rps28e n=1 Tax=Ecytonucleospora hepatopenaei TaxID=646526 RepID=A0A1W0E2B3_9MICR|nr:rps28e [Ecytonucleospora hepatopenaei]